MNDNYKLAAIAFKAAFLFFGDADFTNFKAADLMRFVLDDFLFAGLRFAVVLFTDGSELTTGGFCFADFFAVVFLRLTVRFFVVVLRVVAAFLLILLMI